VRIAALILGLFVSGAFGFQSLLGTGLAALGNDATIREASAVGMFSAFLGLIGSAFALGLPGISAVCFLLAGVIGRAISNSFADAGIWAVLYFALAGLSLLGRRELARKRELGQRVSPDRQIGA
jgi:hypothetical protein